MKLIDNIKFSSKAVENSDIRSYVLLSYLENSVEENEVVGVVDERVDIFTLHTDSITSSEIIKVEGVAPPETDVLKSPPSAGKESVLRWETPETAYPDG